MRPSIWFAAVASLCAPALADVDPAAKKALEEASEAIKNLPPATFSINMATQGLGSFAFSSDMKVKLIRGKAKDAHSYHLVGTFQSPGQKAGDEKVHAALIDGKMGQWLDDSAKTLFIRPLKGGPKSDVLSKVQTPAKAFEVVFLENDPFKTEINAPTITMEKAATVGGEDCQVIKAVLSGGSATRMIYVSALDKLPRKYEQIMNSANATPQVRSFTITELNTEVKLSVADLNLKAPEGYKTDKVDAPPPAPKPVAPAPSESDLEKQKQKKEGLTDEEKKKQMEKESEREERKNKEKEATQRKADKQNPPDFSLPQPTKGPN